MSTTGKKKKTVDVVEDILKSILEKGDLKIWDISFKKEGASWFLCVYIYRDGGNISFDDCENVSKLLGAVLDERDVIQNAYFLEVSSAGIEKQLVKDWHYDMYKGHIVVVKLIKPIFSNREHKGVLNSFDKDNIVLTIDGQNIEFERKNISGVKLFVDINFDGGIHKSE